LRKVYYIFKKNNKFASKKFKKIETNECTNLIYNIVCFTFYMLEGESETFSYTLISVRFFTYKIKAQQNFIGG